MCSGQLLSSSTSSTAMHQLSCLRPPNHWVRQADMDSEGRLPIEQNLRRRLSALGPTGRAALLRTLAASEVDRATRIKTFYDAPAGRAIAELLMDLEEDVAARGLVIAELHAMERED